MRNPKLKGFLAALILACAALVVFFFRSYQSHSADVERRELGKIQELTSSAAARVAAQIDQAKLSATFIAKALSGEPGPVPETLASLPECNRLGTSPSRAGAEECLEAVVKTSADFYGASITDRPAPNPSSVYVYKVGGDGDLRRGVIPDEYVTSTDDGYRWYRDPMQSGKDGWCLPYYDDAGRVLMTTYSAVFRTAKEGSQPAGIVTIDISGDQLREMVQDLELGPSGYGALSAANGMYLYHPNPEYVQNRRSIIEVAHDKGDKDRELMWSQMQRGESGTIHHKSTLVGEDSWLLFASVGDSGWHLQNTFIKSDIEFNVDLLRHELIETASAVGVLLIALLIYALRLDLMSDRGWWLLSTGVSMIFLAEIGTIWALTLAHPPARETVDAAGINPHRPGGEGQGCSEPLELDERRSGTRRITEFGALHQVEAQYRQRALCQHSLTPVFVEVGTSVENLKFLGSNEVQIGGYVWQRIPRGAPAAVSADFTLANAVDLSKDELETRSLPDGSRVRRWRFEATVAQNRNSSRYPIEREAVRIQFKHDESVVWVTPSAVPNILKEPDPVLVGAPEAEAPPAVEMAKGYRVYLVPALADYDVMTPSARPGVDRSLVVPGWRPKQSYFELSTPQRGSNLGLGLSTAEIVPPDLNFSIVFERDFADAFISNLTPIIVVAIMLFAVLMVSAKLDYGRALSICMGMFFVIVFGHIDLRQRLAAQHIFYLEYFFFAIYAMILCVSFACLLQAFNTKIAWFEHRGRLFIKAAYWPILLGTLYACTLLAFF